MKNMIKKFVEQTTSKDATNSVFMSNAERQKSTTFFGNTME